MAPVRVNMSYSRADQHVLPQRHRPGLVDDDGGAAADLAEPVAELLGVADRRGQGDHLHRLGQLDDHLFPDRAAEPVGEVVHLVQHHVARPPSVGEPAYSMFRSTSVVITTTGASPLMLLSPVSSPTLAGAVAADQVGVLLVRQRLDRRGVEALAALCQREVHGELADDRLAGAGRRRDQHAVPGVQRPARGQLEFVEFKAVQLLEGR